jgi:serine/threonine protein kinase
LEVERELGQGRYGRVCMGKWIKNNQKYQVALKFCHNKSDLNEFMREAKLMISLPSHPNVVRVFGVSIDGVQPIIVMEYCDAGIHSSSSFSQYILSNNKSH